MLKKKIQLITNEKICLDLDLKAGYLINQFVLRFSLDAVQIQNLFQVKERRIGS